MKPVENLVRDNIKNLKPCVHGGEVLDAAGKSGLKREEILDFSSSVNPLGPSKKALEAAKQGFHGNSSLPRLKLQRASASHRQPLQRHQQKQRCRRERLHGTHVPVR